MVSFTELLHFFPRGYLLSVLIETPVLLCGLSPRHSFPRKVFAGFWLTACTYPVVTLILPLLLRNFSNTTYLVVAETFAPVAECLLFWLAYGRPEDTGTLPMWRDFGTILAANFGSFLGGELLKSHFGPMLNRVSL